MKILKSAILLIAITSAAHGDLVVSHYGATNPEAEGWNKTGSSTGIVTGAVTNDLGLGIDAWSIDDDSTTNSSLIYTAVMSAENASLVVQNGWKLKVKIRVIDIPTTPVGDSPDANSIIVKVRPGSGGKEFDLVIGYEVNDGQPSILVNGIAHWIDDYALIEVEHTPQVGDWGDPILTMKINGTLRYNNRYADPDGSGAAYVSFGSEESLTTGHAHWAELTFESLPDFVPPEISDFHINQANRLSFRFTNIRRGVYYRLEKSVNLIDWDFAYGVRPSDYGDIFYSRNLDGEKYFYRLGIR